jgi:hypothetical protein
LGSDLNWNYNLIISPLGKLSNEMMEFRAVHEDVSSGNPYADAPQSYIKGWSV